MTSGGLPVILRAFTIMKRTPFIMKGVLFVMKGTADVNKMLHHGYHFVKNATLLFRFRRTTMTPLRIHRRYSALDRCHS